MVTHFFSLIYLNLIFSAGVEPESDPADEYWQNISLMCGQAFEGGLVLAPDMALTEDWHEVVHVHPCEDDRITMRFFNDRQPLRMTRFLIRHDDGRLELRHDYRDLDGGRTDVTGHGGFTTNPGGAESQVFPADTQMIEMAPAHWEEPWKAVWLVEIKPGERFTYMSHGVGRGVGYRFDFDLSRPVEPPPPWN
jgi:hypothetical protein